LQKNILYIRHAFQHATPVQLKTVSMIYDMPELAVSGHGCGKRSIEERGQGLMGRFAKPLEQINVPGISRRHRDRMKTADAFQNILHAAVELGHESRGCRLFPNRRFPRAHIRMQCGKLAHDILEQLQLYSGFFAEFIRCHNSTFPLRSISLVNRVCGVSGTISSGACSSSSRRAASS